MSKVITRYAVILSLTIVLAAPVFTAYAQAPVLVSADKLEKVVPSSFYFEGQVAPTQMRNGAAVRFGESQNLIAALVDTSGYASNIRSKYEGFIISDVSVKVGAENLSAGAYGFGFTEDGKMNIFDIGGKKLITTAASKDDKLQSPRPLMISIVQGNRIRLYRGKSYVEIAR